MTPFDGDDGTWLRCALHAHTTNSDGDLPPDKLVRHYEWAGYDVVAITDHWVRTVERSTRRTLVIPSVELNARCGGAEHDAHVLALGIEADPVIPDNEFAQLEDVVHATGTENVELVPTGPLPPGAVRLRWSQTVGVSTIGEMSISSGSS